MALARSVLMLADLPDARQPEDIAVAGKLKVVQVVKSNFSIPPAPMLFRRPLDAPVLWLGPSVVDIEACFGGATGSGPKARERDEAAEFLREALAAGPVAAQELLRQAKQRLKVVAMRRHAQAPWFWRLPTLEEAAPDGQMSI